MNPRTTATRVAQLLLSIAVAVFVAACNSGGGGNGGY
jgi:hypothetical protein